MASTATQPQAGEAISREVLRPGRRHPIVVVSQNRQAPEALIDAKALERDLKGIAVVYVLDDIAPHGLAGLLPDNAAVYGNAARVYEPKALAQGHPPRFRPHVAFDRRSAWAAAGRAIDDARACALSKGPTPAPDSNRDPRPATATIHGFLGEGQHALARTPEGTLVTVDAERTIPGIPLDWYLSPGQQVTGKTLPGGQIDISSMLLQHRLSLVYQPGSTVLALARNVTATQVELTLFPGGTGTWTVAAPDGLADEGEVVCALYVHDRGAVRLSLTEGADEPSAEAPPLVPDGPPWLVPGRSLPRPAADLHRGSVTDSRQHQPAQDDIRAPEPGALNRDATADRATSADGRSGTGTTPGTPAAQEGPSEKTAPRTPGEPSAQTAAVPAPGPVPRPGPVQVAPSAEDLEQARARMASDLRRVLQEGAELRRQLAIAEDEIRGLRAEVSGLKKKLRSQARVSAPQTGLFADPLEGLRHEIYTTWAGYLPPAEKDRYPAPSRYWIGPELPATLDALTAPGDRAKALETIVDILVRREERRRTMAIKPLMTRKQRQHQRWDGALAWRVRIENNTPAAHRLHYWTLPDGTIELWTVNSHDDYPRSTADPGPALLVG